MVATKYMTKSFSLNFGSRIAKYPLDSEIGSLQVVFIGNSMKSVIKKTKQNKPKVFSNPRTLGGTSYVFFT